MVSRDPVWWSEEPVEQSDIGLGAIEDRAEFVKVNVVRGAREAYGGGRLTIYLHVHFAKPERDDLESRPLDSAVKDAEGLCLEVSRQRSQLSSGGRYRDIGQDTDEETRGDKAVFVAVGEPVQDRQGVFVRISSVVRLHLLHRGPCGAADEAKDSRIREGPRILVDRELDAARLALSRVAVEVVACQPKYDVVECASAVVDEVSEDKPQILQHRIEGVRPARKRIVERIGGAEDKLPLVRVMLHDNSVEVRVRSDVFVQAVERIEVFTCAI